MIITVKTLDSQNHQFTVDDNFTVAQFKSHIEERVNIPAARQRIIYCGRVLQDESKLMDYDVDGKVVHLVQRAPPGSSTRTPRSITPPPDLNRARGGFRGFERVGNTVYMGMGSMSFPQGIMDAQQRIPPRATHTLIASRLNVARRMLRSAENVIRQLENPSGNTDQQPAEEPVEEEMTPVIEARVIVPSNGGQAIDENAIVNAVENTIFASGVGNLESGIGPSTSSQQNTDNGSSQQSSASTPPEASTPRSSSTENLNSQNTGESSRERPSRTRCRGTEMAELLTTLNQLQARFAPYLARYQSFMQDDPELLPENVQETRQMITRVSQVLHYFGHAYHSLSDIMINVEQQPPRLLLCRPILIQQSAVVQAGIPIQVEAQINLSSDRQGSNSNSTTSNTGTTTNTNSNSAENSTTSNVTVNETPNVQAQPQLGGPSINLQPGFVGLPFMQSGSVRVITTPIEIHSMRPNGTRPRTTTNSNNGTATAPTSAPTTNQNTAGAPQSTTPGENAQPGPQQPQPQGIPFGSGNGNLEFFMEVTPEVLRGGNLIQSLMQIVGSQLGGNVGQTLPQSQSATGGDSTQQNSPANGANQNFSQSQARSTQTNPTTSTHTRSTPRPHVHMTQQAVQGGFDPFLPCYSHHVNQSRGQRIVSMSPQQSTTNRTENSSGRETSSTAGQAPSSTTTPPNREAPTQGIQSHLAGLATSFESMVRGLPPHITDFSNLFYENQQTARMLAEAVSSTMRAARQPGVGNQPQRSGSNGQEAVSSNQEQVRLQQDILGFISRLMGQNLPDLIGNGPTLDQYVQSIQPEPYVQGESLITDLIMLMLRNLRLNDLIMLTNGNMTPLQRQMDTVQGFFLTNVCQNDTSDAGIDRATERIMNDFGPLINALQSIPPKDDIDMVGTIEGFFRQRLPEIIRMAINRGSTDTSNLLTVIWRAAKELLALTIHCSANGATGVLSVCEEMMVSTFFNQTNIPSDIHNWTLGNSRTALRSIVQNLDVPCSEVERYVIRKQASQGVTETEEVNRESEMTREVSSEVESMEVEYAASPSNEEPHMETRPISVEGSEPLPNVIWGSEPWHGQTPEEWVPIITRDVQNQRKQNSQPPFSDAYLSGMPSKRRKIINNSKPQGSLPQAISENVRQAITETGLTSTAPIEIVAQAAGESTEIQAAYRTLLRSTVQANLRDNEDFTPERYPNAAVYFNGSPPE